ncbi:hypothetical protein HY357_02235 [Candidatus Roizmanbacteria bacterium]|nr:hypothetical protein [Candidatus Roizmanbacteria bacterium]
MKQTHISNTQITADADKLTQLLYAKKLFEEKTRINLYLPKIVVRLIDSLAKNSSRGELVTSLVMEKVGKNKKTPHGMFSPLEISEEEIEGITSSLNPKTNELT